MAYKKKYKPLNWQKEHRKKGYSICKCGAVIKYCKCGLNKKEGE